MLVRWQSVLDIFFSVVEKAIGGFGHDLHRQQYTIRVDGRGSVPESSGIKARTAGGIQDMVFHFLAGANGVVVT